MNPVVEVVSDRTLWVQAVEGKADAFGRQSERHASSGRAHFLCGSR